MADTETADDARDTRAVGYDRLAIASITLSVVGLVLAVATWAAWLLLIRPTPLRIYRTGLGQARCRRTWTSSGAPSPM